MAKKEKKKYKYYYKSKKEKEYEARLASLTAKSTIVVNLTARKHTAYPQKDGSIVNIYESIYK